MLPHSIFLASSVNRHLALELLETDTLLSWGVAIIWLLVETGFEPLLPYNLIPFLERAAQLRLLHRVGGGYIFIHDLLRDHIATLDLEEWERKLVVEGLLETEI